jgi:hypothetical protein
MLEPAQNGTLRQVGDPALDHYFVEISISRDFSRLRRKSAPVRSLTTTRTLARQQQPCENLLQRAQFRPVFGV